MFAEQYQRLAHMGKNETNEFLLVVARAYALAYAINDDSSNELYVLMTNAYVRLEGFDKITALSALGQMKYDRMEEYDFAISHMRDESITRLTEYLSNL